MKTKPPASQSSFNSQQFEGEVLSSDSPQITDNFRHKSRSRWTQEQNIRYAHFLKQNIEIFKKPKLRKLKTIFSLLSKHMSTRSAVQAKSHHQKMMKKHGLEQKIIECILDKAGTINVTIIQEGQQKDIKRNQNQEISETDGFKRILTNKIIDTELLEDQESIWQEGEICKWFEDI